MITQSPPSYLTGVAVQSRKELFAVFWAFVSPCQKLLPFFLPPLLCPALPFFILAFLFPALGFPCWRVERTLWRVRFIVVVFLCVLVVTVVEDAVA